MSSSRNSRTPSLPGKRQAKGAGRGRRVVVAAVILTLGAALAWTVPLGGRTLVSRWRGPVTTTPTTERGEARSTPDRRSENAAVPTKAIVEQALPVRAPAPTEDIRAEDRAAVDALMR